MHENPELILKINKIDCLKVSLFLPYFEPEFVTLECGILDSNRFDFWNQRSRISLEPNFELIGQS